MPLSRRPLVALGAALVLTGLVPASTAASTAASVPTGRTVELKAAVPAWYTPELDAKVRAAGTAGVPLPEGALKDVPKSGLAFIGIRPGSWILSPAGCTTNFVFQSSAGAFHPNQTLFIGTAGHCANQGQRVTLVAIGPGTSQPVLVSVGTVSKSVNGGVGNDFALIQIDTRFNSWVSPAMAYWGGPTGSYTGGATTAVVHAGHGIGIGTGGTPRAGVMLAQNNDARYWDSASIFGDSGSGVNTATGLAAANLTHLVVFGPNLTVVAGTHITKILQMAAKPLSTCPTRTPWPLPGCPAA